MRIVIAAGGTGGHLYPAVALAREFLRQEPGSRILFVGTTRGIEAKVLPHEGFELQMITAQPVMGRGLWKAATGLLALPVAVGQSLAVLRRERPDLVIGIGGYSSPPVILAAALLRVPRALLEPNAYPGLANKAVGPLADLVFVAYEAAAGYFPPARVKVTGTPVRRAFLEPSFDAGPETIGGRKRLLVFGGSQGAQAINRAMVQALPHLQAVRERLTIVHQTGERDLAYVRQAYEAAGLTAEVVPFLFEMPTVLRSADLVVCRAGAVTLAELTVCGKPAILIPLPTAIYQHQDKNARVMEQGGAAVVLRQSELTGTALADQIAVLLSDAGRLRAMGERSKSLGRADSAEAIVQMCRTLLGGHHGANRPLGAGRA
jgi:UDP-N-acetylglucosamine--N-acetylmuramyl-(pentapeptide) pyrophosphoryl-undecaprenol N-acetylglucosamine transferase